MKKHTILILNLLSILCLFLALIFSILDASINKTHTEKMSATVSFVMTRKDTNEERIYIPVIEYEINNKSYNFIGNHTTNKDKYKKNQKITIYYNKNNVSDAIIKSNRFLIVKVCLFISSLLFFVISILCSKKFKVLTMNSNYDKIKKKAGD